MDVPQIWKVMLLVFLSSATISWVFAHDIKIDKITPKNMTKHEITLNSSYQAVLIYQDLDELLTRNPFRLKASTLEATPSFPILVVVEQIKEVTAFPVPMSIESDINKEVVVFKSVAKTLCHDSVDNIFVKNKTGKLIPAYQSFIIHLSTASSENVDISVELKEEKRFHVKLNTDYNLQISPSEPRYFYYKFDIDTSDTVVIHVYSDDSVCLTISVQNNKCPVFDMEKDIKYEGIHQTMNTKAAITIKKREYPEGGFFLVFVANTDNFECSQENSIIPRMLKSVRLTTSNITSNVRFIINNSISAYDYGVAIWSTLGILLIAFIILLAFFLVLNRHGTISKYKYTETVITDYYEKRSEEKVVELLKTANPTVSLFARNVNRIKKRSYNYVSHTLSIALFYSIPVVQLVVTYQRIVNQTGNEDMCYYNFLCAHPLGYLTDFNHIFSNFGYIVFGILFIIAVFDRHRIIKIRKDRGIPVHNGIYYAMGVALIIEGLLSACYHVCPSQSNYQFDTSFMYVMAVLCMIKLYHNRHPEINATAYTTFTILGAAIFMAMVGILNGSLALWLIFVVCYSILVITISFKIYYMNYVVKGLQDVHQLLRTNGFSRETLMPIRAARFLILLIVNLANYAMLSAGLVLYTKSDTDFATFLLGLLLGNALIHCIFYTTMKLMAGERVCIEAIIYGILGVISWAIATVFFVDAATLWTVTPAESRHWNQECIVAKFFDKHDIWHLLGGPALYFTCMYLMHLDDDILDKLQSELPVF